MHVKKQISSIQYLQVKFFFFFFLFYSKSFQTFPNTKVKKNRNKHTFLLPSTRKIQVPDTTFLPQNGKETADNSRKKVLLEIPSIPNIFFFQYPVSFLSIFLLLLFLPCYAELVSQPTFLFYFFYFFAALLLYSPFYLSLLQKNKVQIKGKTHYPWYRKKKCSP